jgi:hypothetical protein
MVNKIAWSKTSLAELGQILIYFRDEVSESTSERFADLVKLKISQLAANTFDGRPVPTRKSIRFIYWAKITVCIIGVMGKHCLSRASMTRAKIPTNDLI